MNKSNNTYLDTNLDSLVATNSIIGRKTFTSLPSFVSETLDLGNLIIERYCPDCLTVLYEGKTYHTVQIETQCWLKENLDVGTMIQGIQNAMDNGVIEKYCYNDDTVNCTIYGGLYQWNEAMQYVTTQGTKGICPTGWHIPTYAEFQTLKSTVNNDGNSLKAIGQGTGEGVGTNTSGFSALLAGYCYFNGYFGHLGNAAYFWGSTEDNATNANYLLLYYLYSGIFPVSNNKEDSFSIRCVKD